MLNHVRCISSSSHNLDHLCCRASKKWSVDKDAHLGEIEPWRATGYKLPDFGIELVEQGKVHFTP